MEQSASRSSSTMQIRLCAPSSIISRPTCFSSSLRCCWHVGSAPFARHRCDCLASSAPFTNIQTYLLTYLGYLLTGASPSYRLFAAFSSFYSALRFCHPKSGNSSNFTTLPFDFDPTVIRPSYVILPFDCNSTALRPVYVTTCLFWAAALRPK